MGYHNIDGRIVDKRSSLIDRFSTTDLFLMQPTYRGSVGVILGRCAVLSLSRIFQKYTGEKWFCNYLCLSKMQHKHTLDALVLYPRGRVEDSWSVPGYPSVR